MCWKGVYDWSVGWVYEGSVRWGMRECGSVVWVYEGV